MTTARISVTADIVCLSVAYDLGVPSELRAIPTERGGGQNCIVLATKLDHKSAIITVGLLLHVLLTLPLKLARPIVLLNQAA